LRIIVNRFLMILNKKRANSPLEGNLFKEISEQNPLIGDFFSSRILYKQNVINTFNVVQHSGQNRYRHYQTPIQDSCFKLLSSHSLSVQNE